MDKKKFIWLKILHQREKVRERDKKKLKVQETTEV